MSNVTITCTATDETICENLEGWGATDAIVSYYCDNSTPSEVYDACCALGDAIAAGEPTYELEAYLACKVTYC